MAVETDRAVEAAARELVRAERINGVWYLNLPMLYPDGSFVTVRIDQAPGDRVRVSDAGFAYREAERVEAARSFRRTANAFAESADVSIGERSVFVVAPIGEIERAITDVAETSWKIADRICRRVWDGESDELPPSLRERLEKLFGSERLQEGAKIQGSSTNEWEVSAAVMMNDHVAVFQAVHDHANSIYRASTAFRDISLLPSPPRLIAVVQSKEALGNKIALLAPARVLEEEQPDALFLRAAGVMPLSLNEAIKSNRLADFIAQEEARGVGPADVADLERALAAVIRSPQSEDRTSHSPSSDGSTGKRTR